MLQWAFGKVSNFGFSLKKNPQAIIENPQDEITIRHDKIKL
jgi:hypothetical protein